VDLPLIALGSKPANDFGCLIIREVLLMYPFLSELKQEEALGVFLHQ
jgi:hypothetical protein